MAAVKSKLFVVVGALVLLWFARLVWDYFDPNSIANQAMQVQLRLFGSAMYEYHAATGRWPTKLDDEVIDYPRSLRHSADRLQEVLQHQRSWVAAG
jgi:hypothetical protein